MTSYSNPRIDADSQGPDVARFMDSDRTFRHLGIATPSRPIARALERVLGVGRFEALCTRARVSAADPDVPRQIDDLFAAMELRYTVEEESGGAGSGPAGPLIICSNHPYGFADALIALRIALARRPDTKVLANVVLSVFPFNDDHIIWVDLASNRARRPVNQKSMRATLQHLRNGGALLIFPSQVCAHLDLRRGCVTDPPWSEHLLRLIDHSGASVLPVYFEGRNSWRFQLLGLVHPALRTLLLLSEFIALKGRDIRVHVGAAMPASELASGSAVERMRELRRRVYGLGRERDAKRGDQEYPTETRSNDV
jgi:putative hemolysin